MKEIKVVAAIFQRENKVMIARRKKGKNLEGYWEFPGGKIEKGEEPEKALQREIFEEMGTKCLVGAYVCTSIHDYSNFRIHLSGYYCHTTECISKSQDHDSIEWIEPREYHKFKISPADIPIMEKIIDGLK